jgi:rubrerythrin
MPSSERARVMLKTALEMEERGKRFYQGALETCENALARDIFQKLFDEEVSHTARIERIYKGVARPEDWLAEIEDVGPPPDDLSQYFAQLARSAGSKIKKQSTDFEALEVAIDFERASLAYYEDCKKNAAEPLEKRFVERMIHEEKDHLETLLELRSYLADADAWFAKNAGLDG